jgi:hypothetical protein
MKPILFVLVNLFLVSSFAEAKTRFGIESDFSAMITPSNVVAVHGSCQMNDHVRKISFEFTNLQKPPGNFDSLEYDFKAIYQLKNGGTFQFTSHPEAEPVFSLGWQKHNDGSRWKQITAFFGRSGPDHEGLFIDAFDWTSPFEFSSVKNTVTITTKYTWIKFYDPNGINYEPLTGGDCTWVLDLK